MAGSQSPGASAARGARASGAGERAIEAALAGCGALSVLVTAAILATLAGETLAFFRQVPVADFLLDTQWTPLFADKHFGIWPLVAGTVVTSGVALAVAAPAGVLAAIYLSEFASARVRRWLKPALEVLAGVPTIVYGWCALVVVTPLLQQVVPGLEGFNALSAGLVMGMMILPMVSSLSEDALHAVPGTLREAAYGLGAGPLQTIRRVVVPAAGSGIGAAILLATARAIGETMIVAIAAGQQAALILDPRGPIQTMTAFIVQVSMGDTPAGSLEHRTIYAVASALFVTTFLANAGAQRLARKLRGAA